MHIALSGLDPQKEIEFVDVTTEQGGDQWQYNAQSFSWKAELKRAKGSRTADLFLEPGHNDSIQNYHILIRYEDGATHELDVRSRKVNRGLRMPGAALQARWAGQDRQDRVGDGPSVGPDGVQDVADPALGRLHEDPRQGDADRGAGGSEVGVGGQPAAPAQRRILARPEEARRGRPLLPAGARPQGAEAQGPGALRQRDHGLGDRGRRADATPSCKMPEQPLPRLAEVSATARWHGQDGQDVTGPGDVHVTVSGLGRTQGIAAAVLTDSVRGTWIYRSGDRIKAGEPTGDVDRSPRPQARPGSHLDRALLRPLPGRGEGDDDAPPDRTGRPDDGGPISRRRLRPRPPLGLARHDPGRGQAGRRPERPGPASTARSRSRRARIAWIDPWCWRSR